MPGMNLHLLEKHRHSGFKYLGTNQHHRDVTTTIAVHRLNLQNRWGNLSSTEYNSLCKEILKIQGDKSNSRIAHLILAEFENLGETAQIYSMEDGGPKGDG